MKQGMVDLYIRVIFTTRPPNSRRVRFKRIAGVPDKIVFYSLLLASSPNMTSDLTIHAYWNMIPSEQQQQDLEQGITKFAKRFVNEDESLRSQLNNGQYFEI